MAEPQSTSTIENAATAITEGTTVISTNGMYRKFGVGRVLKVKNDIAKVQYTPGLFSEPPLFAHTKLLRFPEIEPVPSPIERAKDGQWNETWRFDLRQMAARFLTANKGGQLANARTELLPHQIFTAHTVVASPKRRFLLADEVGLGKTIEAGMIWQALLQRGQAKRTLIICPAGLTVQWQEEMLDKFGEFFEIFGRDFHTINPRIWDLKECAIASVDALKRKEHKAKLLENRDWDLIIFDEAHRLSDLDYWDETKKTRNFQLAEDLKDHTDALLLLTATPHQAEDNHSRFISLMSLLDDDIDFSSLRADDMPLFRQPETGQIPYRDYVLRTPKLRVTDAQGKRVFKGRNTYPLNFPMYADERRFYDAVTDYIRKGYGALPDVKDRARRMALGFVLTIFQKLAASSSEAIKAALAGRKLRLQEKYARDSSQQSPGSPEDERYLGEWEERVAFEQIAGELVKGEIEALEKLIDMPVKRDRKLIELFSLILRIFEESGRGEREKVLVFTEYRNTQTYIVEALRERFGEDSTVTINGDKKLEGRKAAQMAFRSDDNVRFLVSTEAGGEGINLQFCHILVNYDLPWNPMRIEQRVGRIYRFGQDKVVHVYNFCNKGTVEEKVYGYLERRLDYAAEALSGITGESKDDIKATMLGHIEGEVRYNEIYKRTLVEGSVRQSQKEIDEGVRRAREAYQIATQALFRDVSSYSFDSYQKALRSTLGLNDLEAFTERFLRTHHRKLTHTDGLLEFLTPEGIEQPDVKGRYARATFDRDEAIRDSSLEFLALGHPFVDAMIRGCGNPDFGGYTAVRLLHAPEAHPMSGAQFNFIIRSRVQREDGEEYLFDFATVFVIASGKVDEAAAALCQRHYADAESNSTSGPQSSFDFDAAFQTARAHLESKLDMIWDWDEDVELLNLAWVEITG